MIQPAATTQVNGNAEPPIMSDKAGKRLVQLFRRGESLLRGRRAFLLPTDKGPLNHTQTFKRPLLVCVKHPILIEANQKSSLLFAKLKTP